MVSSTLKFAINRINELNIIEMIYKDEPNAKLMMEMKNILKLLIISGNLKNDFVEILGNSYKGILFIIL